MTPTKQLLADVQTFLHYSNKVSDAMLRIEKELLTGAVSYATLVKSAQAVQQESSQGRAQSDLFDVPLEVYDGINDIHTSPRRMG